MGRSISRVVVGSTGGIECDSPPQVGNTARGKIDSEMEGGSEGVARSARGRAMRFGQARSLIRQNLVSHGS